MAIAFDSYTQMAVGSGTSQTLAHTCSGTDRVLVVGILKQGTGRTPTGVTYNGVAMTQVVSTDNTLASVADEYLGLWILENPASGTNNIVASFTGTGTSILSAASYTGAKQTGQPDSSNTNEISVASTTHSVSTTTVADNSWLVGYIRANSGTYTAISGTTLRETGFSQVKMGDSNAAKTPAGSYSFGGTISPARTGNALVLSISPAVAAGTTHPQFLGFAGL